MKGFALWIVIVLMVAAVAMIAAGVTLGVTSGPTPGPIATLSSPTGEVLVQKEGSETWVQAVSGMKLEEGDGLKTGSDGYAEITFFDGSVMEVEANSEISIEELSIAAGIGSTTVHIGQVIGNTVNRVGQLIDSASQYEVETPAGSAVVEGTRFKVLVEEDGYTTVVTEEGDVRFIAREETVVVSEGRQSSAEPGEPPSTPLPIEPTPTPTVTPTPTATPVVETLGLVPDDANFVASTKINEILTDPDIIAFYSEVYSALGEDVGMPATLDEALDELEAESGIDPRDFSEVLIFGDSESDDYFGGVIKGTFDAEALIESMEEAFGEEAAISTYKGYQIYTITVEGESVAICFLSADTIVVGLETLVRDVIDVKEGDKASLSGPVYDTYVALGDVWIKGAGEIPEGVIGEMPEEEELPDLEAFEDMEVVGFGLDKASLQVKLCFSSAGSAAAAESALIGLRSLAIQAIEEVLAEMAPDDVPPELVEWLEELPDWLNSISISQSGSWVTITTADGVDFLMMAGVIVLVGGTISVAEDTAYDVEKETLGVAVMCYYVSHGSTWPATDSININVDGVLTECKIIDMCRLLDPPGGGLGYLDVVPYSCAEIAGSDNCDQAGADGVTCNCDPNAHYIWAMDTDDGTIHSACDENLDGVLSADDLVDGYHTDVYP